jgi:hypothetical protein
LSCSEKQQQELKTVDSGASDSYFIAEFTVILGTFL